ncbi:transmembrane amino acid transporter protein-domain-containing protein [Pavlovales sp. CCMP2436]|nr:transmembrane amino acid transporter protein-domain-containing protein [Pavlovales sp. CCMP2436]
MDSDGSDSDPMLRSSSQLSMPLLPVAEGDVRGPRAPATHATAGLLGSVFNLCAATLGAGALSLPYAVSLVGVRLALALLAVAVVGAFLSIELLVAALDSAGCSTYEAVTRKRLGARAAALVEVAILAFCVGTCVAYTIALGDILDQLLAKPKLLPSWAPHTRTQLTIAAWALLLLPISLPRSLAALQSATFVSTAALCVLVGTVVAHAARADTPQSPPLPSPPPAGPGGAALAEVSRLASALSIIMFAFTCQVNVPEVYAELRDRSARRMRISTAGALATALVLYVLVGVAGFWEFGRETRSDILQNYDVWAADGRDRGMLPAYALMGVAIVVAYPFNVLPARQTILVALGADERGAGVGLRGRLGEGALHVALTVAITGSSLICALFVPGIHIVFQLLGGTASALVCFCVPGLLALRSELPLLEGRSARLAVFLLVGGGALVGVVSTLVTVMGLVVGEGR